MNNFNKKPTTSSKLIYFQIGLIVTLVLVLFFIEQTSREVKYKDKAVLTDVFEMEKSFNQKVIFPKTTSVKTHQKKSSSKIIPEKANEKDLVDEIFKKKATSQIDDKKLDLEDPDDDFIEDLPVSKPIGIKFVSEVPVFPGCENFSTRNEQIECFSSKVKKLVAKKFNGNIASNLDLKGKQNIYVNFTVSDTGEIVDIKAISKNQELIEEAVRVTKLLPRMKPGKQNGQPVSVNYTLPISLNIN